MLARAHSYTIDGLDARPLTVEVDVRPGLPSTTVIGYNDTAVRELRDTVHAAILNSDFDYPQGRVTINIAPLSIRRAGVEVHLPAALGILAASGQLDPQLLTGTAVYAELSVTGMLRSHVRGAITAADACRREDIPTMLMTRADASAAAELVQDTRLVGVSSLAEAVRVLQHASSGHTGQPRHRPEPSELPDLSDIRADPAGLRGLELAAAGGHYLMLHGPAGSGRTMLARRLPGILPALNAEEQLEVAKIHSIAGLRRANHTEPPFRAPHHSISPAGLVGGGTPIRPGEASLAHHGVLYLDQLEAFAATSLEALQRPMGLEFIVLNRGERTYTLPAGCLLVAATGPDHCDGEGAEAAVRRQVRTDRLADRFELHVNLQWPEQNHPQWPTTAAARGRVEAARERQAARGQDCLNAHIPFDQLSQQCTADAWDLVEDRYRAGGLSPSQRLRVLRVAHTIADLGASHGLVDTGCVLEALAFTQNAGQTVSASQ